MHETVCISQADPCLRASNKELTNTVNFPFNGNMHETVCISQAAIETEEKLNIIV
jgi:hypothetical protein